MADYIINEGSTAIIGLWFKDENEKNVTPSKVTWRVDDVALIDSPSGELVPNTDETPTSYKHTIYIPASANKIIEDKNIWEEKLLTITFYYGELGVGTEEFRYRVKNLAKIT